MVLDFYKMNQQPFGVTPDPRYLYLGHTHRKALDSLHSEVAGRRGFTALIASPGMGKTTLLFEFLRRARASATTVFLFQPQSTPEFLLRNILEDLSIPCEGRDLAQMQREFNECAIRESKAGRRLIVVIDEAQHLDENILEFVRILSNFETPREKLLHFILAGQPQLAQILANPRLVQLRQRISTVARLEPFDLRETQCYIRHRLRVAGADSQEYLFNKRAISTIFRHSHGIPRDINNLCFNAMSLGNGLRMKVIDGGAIRKVAADLDLQSLAKKAAAVPKSQMPSQQRSWLFSGWRLKAALPIGFISAILATVFPVLNGDLRFSHSALAKASPQITRVVGSQKDVDSSERTPLAAAPSRLSRSVYAVVRPNQNIFRICIELLGRYDEETLTEIRQLNPDLIDLTQIKVGQKIYLPAPHRDLKTIRDPAEDDARIVPTATGSQIR
jgi:general secretion pathway protein A